MGPDSMRQPGSRAAANGTSAQAAAIGQQLSATGQHHCIMLWCHVSSAVGKVMQNAMSRASSGVSCSRHVCKCCSGIQLSPEELTGIRAESAGAPCPVLHYILQ